MSYVGQKVRVDDARGCMAEDVRTQWIDVSP